MSLLYRNIRKATMKYRAVLKYYGTDGLTKTKTVGPYRGDYGDAFLDLVEGMKNADEILAGVSKQGGYWNDIQRHNK